jgi:quercetin dioxygenase-like cupin family protein
MARIFDIDEQPVIALWGETVRARRVQGERITLSVIELDPDAELPSHVHEAEQVGICLRGQMTFDNDGEVRTVGPGGAWAVRSMRPHRATAGPDGATVIEVFTPVRSDWDALPAADPEPGGWPAGGPIR